MVHQYEFFHSFEYRITSQRFSKFTQEISTLIAGVPQKAPYTPYRTSGEVKIRTHGKFLDRWRYVKKKQLKEDLIIEPKKKCCFRKFRNGRFSKWRYFLETISLFNKHLIPTPFFFTNNYESISIQQKMQEALRFNKLNKTRWTKYLISYRLGTYLHLSRLTKNCFH